jgi:hypothetical protein
MTIRGLTTPVDSERQLLTATGLATPVYRFQSDAERKSGAVRSQEVSDEGVPLWEIEALILNEQFGIVATEVIRVKVPSPAQPSVAAAPVRFTGLKVTTRVSKGAYVAYWVADGIELVARSTRSSDHASA